MANNTELNLGTGGDVLRTVEKSGVKTPSSVLDIGGSGAESLVTKTNPLPIAHNTAKDGSGTAYAPLVDSDGHQQVDVLTHKVVSVSTSFTRPADTTMYTNYDVISNSTSAPTVLTFANCAAANGRGGKIINATIIDEASTDWPSSASVYLMLFSEAPTAINDNAAVSVSDTQIEKLESVVQFIYLPPSSSPGTTFRTGSSNAALLSSDSMTPKGFQCAAGDRNLYGLLVSLSAWTPPNAAKYFIRLQIEQD